jgi:hypothetical protein
MKEFADKTTMKDKSIIGARMTIINFDANKRLIRLEQP